MKIEYFPRIRQEDNLQKQSKASQAFSIYNTPTHTHNSIAQHSVAHKYIHIGVDINEHVSMALSQH